MTQIHCNYPNDQLSVTELNLIESKMYPSGYSDLGFLQPGERLLDVLESDKKYLEQTGITPKQIADRLETIVGKYRRMVSIDSEPKNEYLVEDQYMVGSIMYMGAQECPFQNQGLDSQYHGYQYGSSDITILDTKTGKKIIFNTLLIHMARAHQFFESPHCQHRLEPSDVIVMFNLQPGIDYQPKYKFYKKWCLRCSCSALPPQSDIAIFEKYALKKYESEGTKGYLWPSAEQFDRNSFTEIKKEAINKNLSWYEFRKLIFQKQKDDDSQNDFLKEFFQNENKIQYIQNIIDEELKFVNQYLETGNIDKLYLILLMENNSKKIFIEGIEVSRCSGFSLCELKTFEYIPISDTD